MACCEGVRTSPTGVLSVRFPSTPGFQAQRARGHGKLTWTVWSLTSQLDFLIEVPPITNQRAIAHILGTLDDKIELNRRMNETLEAMARALFKSWFVDFDPVRAKAEGRDPGLPQAPRRPVPGFLRGLGAGGDSEGVGDQAIGDLADVVGGTTPSTKRAEPIGTAGRTHGPHPRTCPTIGSGPARYRTADHRRGAVADRLRIAAEGNRPSVIESPNRLLGRRRDSGCDQSGLHRDDAQDWNVEHLPASLGQRRTRRDRQPRERLDLP